MRKLKTIEEIRAMAHNNLKESYNLWDFESECIKIAQRDAVECAADAAEFEDNGTSDSDGNWVPYIEIKKSSILDLLLYDGSITIEIPKVPEGNYVDSTEAINEFLKRNNIDPKTVKKYR